MGNSCAWVGTEKIYQKYHDTEWGVPVFDSRALWEKLILDGIQAGLSWITILKKREAFQQAFAGFDPNIIATWGEPEVQTLLATAGIIRHRGKIEATISNARVWQVIEQEQGFDTYLWRWVDFKPVQNSYATHADIPTFDDLSTTISKDLKKRGFKFCGPKIVYAFMEATGFFNNHTTDCPRHAEVAKLARSHSR